MKHKTQVVYKEEQKKKCLETLNYFTKQVQAPAKRPINAAADARAQDLQIMPERTTE